MTSYLKISNYITFPLIFLLLPEVTRAIEAPSASTASKQTINLNIGNAIFLGGSGTAVTSAISTAISTQPNINENNPPSPSVHSGYANITVNVPNITTLITESNTFSAAVTNEPLFARNYVYGNASSIGYFIPNPNSTLNINWQFENYQISNSPAVSFSEITDTLRISSQSFSFQSNQFIPSGEKYSTVINFTNSIENDNLVSRFSFSDNGNTTDFVNTTDNVNEFVFQGDFPFDIPLAQTISQFLVIEIEHIHTEYSIEAPAVATNQIEEKAGFGGNDETINLSWNTNEKELSFSRIPIDILNNNDSNLLQDKYVNDPLNGGYIEIDPLVYSEDDGYFEGNEIKLVDKDGNLLLRASLPTLAFDNDLYEIDGFNLFAPILNILEVNPMESLWLQDYLDKGGIESLLLNELFIGFDTNGISWENDFDAPVTAFLSYTGIESAEVPEPETPILLLFGFIAFILQLSFMQKNHEVKL